MFPTNFEKEPRESDRLDRARIVSRLSQISWVKYFDKAGGVIEVIVQSDSIRLASFLIVTQDDLKTESSDGLT